MKLLNEKLNEFIIDFSEKTKYYISKYESFKELTGEEKKARVDDMVISWALPQIDLLPINFVLKICLKKIVEFCLPSITQAVFNLIKCKVDGITDIWNKD